jgi:carbon-monoxide dehydrogenase medium subunit
MRPQGVALPILNMAIWLDRWGDRMKDIRIAVGPAGPVPQRACGLEEALLGRSPDAETLKMARNRLRESLTFRTSPMRASAAYRYELCEVLLEEVLAAAWKQALDEV